MILKNDVPISVIFFDTKLKYPPVKVVITTRIDVCMAVMLFQILVCLLVVAVGMVAYGVARLIYM